jgi:1-acyl-sn-glycerol-3-phosphate acyltransferase
VAAPAVPLQSPPPLVDAPPPLLRGEGFWHSRPRAFLTSLFIIAITGLLSSLAIVTFPLSPRGGIYHWLARRWPRMIFRFGGIALRTQVDPKLSVAESYLYLSNHESLTDILALLAGLPQTVVMVAKRSLLILPIFSWGMWLAGFVFINRKDRSAAYRSMEAAGKRLRRGRSVVVFPEGTRSDGGELLPFKRGSFLLSLAGKIPVVPVGIYGTRSVLPRDHFCVYPGCIAVCVGAPIPPPTRADELPAFTARVKVEVDRLRAEARVLAEAAS